MTSVKKYLDQLIEIKQRDIKVLLKKQYRGIWETAIKKYSDSAHFVFELLQNADDAKASWVDFNLEESGLWFRHNGTVRFTISDPEKEDEDTASGKLGHINSITSIGNSNKLDEHKIGKFGIGFKAVFAYSNTPHIYDELFSFKLENYIVPNEIAPYLFRKKGETLFYFPFNNPGKDKDEAYFEIQDKLESLSQPILFLTHITELNWKSKNKKGNYSKLNKKNYVADDIQVSLIEIVKKLNKRIDTELIWIFSSELTGKTTKSRHKISVGFVEINNKLETRNHYPAFCFFPTKEETNLGFIIQAPFKLTDSREGINANDNWNKGVIKLIADLAANSLPILKQIGIETNSFFFNDDILEIIPYDEDEFTDIDDKSKISFKPFYTAIKNKLLSEELLPGNNGRYYSSDKAYWASDPELAELFTDEQISILLDNPDSGWVFVSKGQKQLNQANKDLEYYISSLVEEVLDPKKLLRRITEDFIEGQTDEWLLRFYEYLGGRKYLWDDKDRLALKRPILLNQHRKAIVPFDEDLVTPNIFLPAGRSTTYDTIYRTFIENEEALSFIKALGIDKPDLKAEIYKYILPQYNGDIVYEDLEAVKRHFEAFLTYFESCNTWQQSEFKNKLQQIYFIAGRQPSDTEILWFCSPNQVYFNTEINKLFYNDSDEVFMLDEVFYSEFMEEEKKKRFINFLIELGVSSYPIINTEEKEISFEIKEQFGLDSVDVSNKLSNNQKINDKRLIGIDRSIKRISIEESKLIWDVLLLNAKGNTITTFRALLQGVFVYVPKWNQYERSMFFDSSITSTLKNEKWLYNNQGNLVSVVELTLEELADFYDLTSNEATVLLEYLGITDSYADLGLSDEQRQALIIGKKNTGRGRFAG